MYTRTSERYYYPWLVSSTPSWLKFINITVLTGLDLVDMMFACRCSLASGRLVIGTKARLLMAEDRWDGSRSLGVLLCFSPTLLWQSFSWSICTVFLSTNSWAMIPFYPGTHTKVRLNRTRLDAFLRLKMIGSYWHTVFNARGGRTAT